ncbi:hypothetical protein HanIR_Chr12g0613751 [Helianthus annuus]|nr:hypothetical protein HanIR_Chr12g0613751 [Helianthus annuus]
MILQGACGSSGMANISGYCSLFACLANTLGATESVIRVVATGHDKRMFLKVRTNDHSRCDFFLL